MAGVDHAFDVLGRHAAVEHVILEGGLDLFLPDLGPDGDDADDSTRCETADNDHDGDHGAGILAQGLT